MKAPTGKELKEAGQQIALFNAGRDWADDMLDKLKAFCKVRREMNQSCFRFEEFRNVAEQSGWTRPVSHKAWGSLPRLAARRGIIRATGEYEPAQSPKTHAHAVRRWMAL